MGAFDCASTYMPDDATIPNSERLVDSTVAPDQRTYALIMHLSLIAFHVLPLALVIAPLVMWLIKKDESAFLDDHGREAVNFQLSLFIYSLVLTALAILTCGIAAIGFVPLYVLAIVGMIMAAVAAHKGEYFRYPATLRLI